MQRTGADAPIGDCGLYTGGERVPGRVPLGRAAHAADATDGYVWVGLREPTDADIAEVAEEFALPALAVEDAVHAHQRPKLEIYDDVVFAVLKPVRYVDHVEVVEVTEIAMFLRPQAVVSVRHGEGKVVLLGFRAQNRDQTHGTFKLVFNALLNGPPAAEAGMTNTEQQR